MKLHDLKQFSENLWQKTQKILELFLQKSSDQWSMSEYWKRYAHPIARFFMTQARSGSQLFMKWITEFKKIQESSIFQKMKQAGFSQRLRVKQDGNLLDALLFLRLRFEKFKVQIVQAYYRKKKEQSIHVSQRGLQFGILLGVIGTLITVGALGFFANRAQNVALRVAQDSLNSSAQVLGAHFKYKLEGYREIVQMFAAIQVDSLEKKNETFVAAPFSVIPEIIDISLWAARTQESAFEAGPQYTRARLFLNTRSSQMSPEFYKKILESEISERNRVQMLSGASESLQIAPGSFLSDQKIVMLTLKIPHPEFQLIAVAHLQLSALYAALNDSGLAFAAFVDERGKTLIDAHRSSEKLSDDHSGSIRSMMNAMKSNARQRGFIEFQGESGQKFIGSFERLGVGQSAILALLPVDTVTSGFQIFTLKSITLLMVAFLIFFSFGYSLFSRSTQMPPELSSEEERRLMPQKATVTVLHGSLRQLFYILEIESPEQARDTLNEFFTLAAQLIRQSGGLFERVSGRSFIGVWGVPDAVLKASEVSVRIALELRKAYFSLDEARRVDGQKPFSYTLGVHEGEVLAAQLGPRGESIYSVAGDVIQQTAALEGVALTQKKDLLISDVIWQQVKDQFQSRNLGEGKLSAASGLVSFYEVSAYRAEGGQYVEVSVHPLAIQDSSSVGAILETSAVEMVVQQAKDLRWVVNNGNQIIGPFNAHEIANLLFTQELDFDCECWEEISGRSSQIKTSGIFSGVSEDQNAHFWMYDGQTIHGPVTLGFIQTAIQHAAISGQVWICDSSTIQGWKPFDVFLATQKSEGGLELRPAPPLREHSEQGAAQDSLKKAA